MSLKNKIINKLDLLRFFQGLGPQPAPHLTTQRNVYILPTRAGYFFAITLFIMLLGTINYSNSLGYFFTFLLGSFAIVSILHTYKNLLNLRIEYKPIEPVFAGEITLVPIEINSQNNTAHLALELQQANTQPIRTIDPHAEQLLTRLPLKTLKRGRYPMPRIIIASRFPVGLFRAWTHVHFDTHYVVYPSPAVNVPPPPVSHYRFCLLGEQGHGSDDFIGLRTFHPGDSLKHVHWKAFARQQNLLTKQFGGDRSEELWFDWQTLAAYGYEERLSIMARWIIDAENAALAFGLRLPDVEIEPGLGVLHKRECLEKLALFGVD